ncbi:MAG TPA: hypothetical protein VFA55_02200 [Candidatus Kapabacteria bacterium]|nr:hypothetical protein [Candidatus Kapabacteria bacterium]
MITTRIAIFCLIFLFLAVGQSNAVTFSQNTRNDTTHNPINKSEANVDTVWQHSLSHNGNPLQPYGSPDHPNDAGLHVAAGFIGQDYGIYNPNYGDFNHYGSSFTTAISATYRYTFNAFTLQYLYKDVNGNNSGRQLFQHLSFLYGYCFKKAPFFCVSIGPDLQKSILGNGTCTNNISSTDIAYTFGVALLGQAMFKFWEDVGGGLLIYEYANKIITNGGVLLCVEYKFF